MFPIGDGRVDLQPLIMSLTYFSLPTLSNNVKSERTQRTKGPHFQPQALRGPRPDFPNWNANRVKGHNYVNLPPVAVMSPIEVQSVRQFQLLQAKVSS